MENATPPFRFPIQIQITTLILGLIILLGSLLAWYNYQKSSEIIYSASNRLFEHIHRELQQQLKITYQPISKSLSLMRFIRLDKANNLEQRLLHLPLFQTALIAHPAAAGIQIGYEDGDYFIVRRLDKKQRITFEAPIAASIMVDHIDRTDQRPSEFIRLFYDSGLQELSRRQLPDNQYDPRTRNWYTSAITNQQRVTTEPYLFFFMRMVGITISLPMKNSNAVIAADVTLQQLAETIAAQKISPSAEVIIANKNGDVLAYKDTDQSIQKHDDNKVTMSHLSQLDNPIMKWFKPDQPISEQELDFTFNNQQWTGGIRTLESSSEVGLFTIIIAPREELLAEAIAMRWQSAKITLLLLILSIPIAWLLAKRISTPLKILAAHAGKIRQLDFSKPLQLNSMIKEVDELAEAMREMAHTISRFLNLIDSLAREKDFDNLQARILIETRDICHADAALLYLIDESETLLTPSLIYNEQGAVSGKLPDIRLDNADEPLIAALTEIGGQNTIISDTNSTTLSALAKSLNKKEVSLIPIPLQDRQLQSFGLLCLVYTDRSNVQQGLDPNQHSFVNALAGFAAVSLESKQLVLMQKRLLDAFIKLIAGAIDAKSPYTGGHCQRVPELTRMLCNAAHQSDQPPYSDYQLSDDEWEALDIASWLHDCGKVTTPEFVVDKATKLETLYDRIHEIRMRFEVLKRDAEIQYYKALSAGGNPAILAQERDESLACLDDEFAFVAECNQGGEYMSEQKMQRLEEIANRTWLRTLDDSIGISWEESQRKQHTSSAELPIAEKLLADKQVHIIPRREEDRITDDNPYGFKVDTPEYKYNRGELYNLKVAKGTLNDEERYMINDHIVQTIIMLEKLPYPKHLRAVPAIAGGHHEKLDGTGYPKRLANEQLTLSARVMAIADIFEALTAADRPYKTPKKLSESLRIMSMMAKDQHIDSDLFKLFLRSDVYMDYANKYLSAEQLDTVEIKQYLDA